MLDAVLTELRRNAHRYTRIQRLPDAARDQRIRLAVAHHGQPPPPCFSGLAATANKPVALLAASPGPLGGLRAMNTLRQYLQMAFAMIVVPQQFALGRANEAFDDSGQLKEARAAQSVDSVVLALDRLARAMRA